MTTQQEMDTMADALRAQGLTWNQTNFAVSLVRNESCRLQAQVDALLAIVARYVAHDRASDNEMCTALCASNLHRSAVDALVASGR